MATCNLQRRAFPSWCQYCCLGVMKMKPEQSVGRNIYAVVTEISGELIPPLVLG